MHVENIDTCGYAIIDNASLLTHNSLRVDARAKLLVQVRDASALPDLLDFPALRASRPLVLGEGSNILFTGDVEGAVLAMKTRGVHVEQGDDFTRIAVAAGERWDDFVRWTLGQGLAGLENLILIPGTVGAAPIQNIGAYGTEVAEYIESVEAWDRIERRAVALGREACAFGYRDSLFKHEPDRFIITAVRFALPRRHALRLDYAGIREELERMGVGHPAPFHVAEAIVQLRTRKLPDPAVIGNAGSFFKNPIVDAAVSKALKHAHPDLVAWPYQHTHWKLSAAWLIETAGFKGQREGDAGISNRHALVLVNHGKASGQELWAFARRVIEGVHARFGVRLEPEPMVIGPR